MGEQGNIIGGLLADSVTGVVHLHDVGRRQNEKVVLVTTDDEAHAMSLALLAKFDDVAQHARGQLGPREVGRMRFLVGDHRLLSHLEHAATTQHDRRHERGTEGGPDHRSNPFQIENPVPQRKMAAPHIKPMKALSLKNSSQDGFMDFSLAALASSTPATRPAN